MDNILSNKYTFDDFNPNALALQIATNVKKRRLELNITQIELAQKSQVSLGSIKRFETSAEISLKNLLLISVALNATHEFKSLFSQQQFQSIDELTEAKKNKDRKRARKK